MGANHGCGERPFVLASDSPEEALAFLACALREMDGAEGSSYLNTACVTSPDALRKVAATSLDAILVAESRDTELAAISFYMAGTLANALALP